MTSLRSARRLAGLFCLFTLALLAPGLALAPAGATTTTVTVANMAFTPSTVAVTLGNSVGWHFLELHTSTSNQGFWNSGHRSSGTFVQSFPDAGTFGYHCTIHPMMTGQVRVPMSKAGRPAAGYHLRWSVRTSTPANRRYDVQYRRAGTTRWITFRSATARRLGFFNPARAGTYAVRARTRNVGVGASGWSPVLSVRIT